MADAETDEVGSLESPKKRLRLESEEPSDIFTSGIDKETSHLPTSSEINSPLAPGDHFLEGKPLLNFDPESGAGFEHELPSDAANRDDRVPTHFDNDFLPEQNDSSVYDHCLPCQVSSNSPTVSDTNVSLEHDVSEAENEEENSSGSEEGSIESQDDEDLDLGLGECELDQPIGPMGWLQRQMMSGVHPRSILARLLPSVSSSLPEDLNEFELWSIIADYFQMLREPPRRKKLLDFNTFEDALNLLRSSKRIMVLTGAGVSVSCGIPDFRSRDGVYARLAMDFPDLPDPQAIFDIHYFRRNPRPFFKFAKEIYPGEFRPSTCHKFIALLERHGKLLRNFSQNIDTLEQVAGITKVLQCHGSFATAHCTNCNYQVDADAIRPDIFKQVVPLCPHCPPDPDILTVMKPDIVFFGEGLPKDFYHCLDEDKDKVDLLIVIGSSLKVQPVATIPNAIPGSVPQILINREPLNHMTFDIELLGDGDVIVNEICRRLGDGWDHISEGDQLEETLEMPEIPKVPDSDSNDSDTVSTPEKPARGFDVANSTSWMYQSNANPSPTRRPSDDGNISLDEGNNSKLTEVKTPSTAEGEPLSESDPGKASDKSESICMRRTSEVLLETEEPASRAGPDEMTSAVARTNEIYQSGSSSHDDSIAKLQPPREPQSKDARPPPARDGLNGQESNGTQNCDVSSTICEEEMKARDAVSALATSPTDDVLFMPKTESASQSGEVKCPNTQPSDRAQFVGPSSLDAGSFKYDAVKDDRKESGLSEVLKTQDEASLSGARPKRKRRNSIALYLNSSSYLFVPPNRYIFHGAEVFPLSRPESPLPATPDDDDDRDRQPEDHRDLNSVATPSALLQQSELPSTSDALMGHLSGAGEAEQQPVSSAMRDESGDPSPKVGAVGLGQGSPIAGNSVSYWEEGTIHNPHGAVNSHLALSPPGNSTLHSEAGAAYLPHSDDLR